MECAARDSVPRVIDPTDLRGQEQAAEARALQERRERDEEIDDLKWRMSSKRGRRTVWRDLKRAQVFHLTFNLNALQMAFNEGQRSWGNYTVAILLDHLPDLYAVMVKENSNDDDAARSSNPT